MIRTDLAVSISKVLDVLALREIDDLYPKHLLEVFCEVLDLQWAHFGSLSDDGEPVVDVYCGNKAILENYSQNKPFLPWGPANFPLPKITLSLYLSSEEIEKAENNNPLLKAARDNYGLQALLGAVNPNGCILIGMRLDDRCDLSPRERIVHRLVSKEIVDRYWSFRKSYRFTSKEDFEEYYAKEYVGKPGCLVNIHGGILRKNATLENYLQLIDVSWRRFSELIDSNLTVNRNLLPGERSQFRVDLKTSGGNIHVMNGLEYLVNGERLFVIIVEARQILQVPLTPREREIAHLIKQGCSNQFIADAFGISLDTVKKHVTSLLRKTSSKNRTELALSHFPEE